MKLLLFTVLCLQALLLVQGKKSCECSECKGELEIGIVLDSSSSISRDEFDKAQDFLVEYFGKFDVGPTGLRVSLITYGRDVHVDDSFNLDTFDNEEDLDAAIMNIPHHHQTYTNTSGGIHYMRTEQLDEAECRPNVHRVGIVITDGVSQKQALTAREAYLARESGIQMFSVGIGGDIDQKELEDIAGNKDHVFTVGSYQKLSDITTSLARETCEAAQLDFTKERSEL